MGRVQVNGETHGIIGDKVTPEFKQRLNKCQQVNQKIKKERKKMNDDMALMQLNWSVITINATLQLLDIYRYILTSFII